MSGVLRPNPPHPVQEPPPSAVPRRPYARPVILHELRLETRAGSMLGVDPFFDPFGELFLSGTGGE